jgi:SPP1 family predicted phage head-tail adaptor
VAIQVLVDMRSGLLRHKIIFQTATDTSDGMGGFTQSWSDTYTCFAAIWPLRSNERLEAMKMESKITHKIRMRYQPGITSSMRIKFGSRYFQISAPINPDERNRELEILAEEIES